MQEVNKKPAPRAYLTHLAILGVVCLLLAGVAAPVAVHRLSLPATDSAPAEDDPPVVAQDEIRAVAIALDDPEAPYERRLRELAAGGVKAVCFAIPIWQENLGSNSLFIESRRLAPESRIEKLIALADELGMTTIVMPEVRLTADGQHPGQIQPSQLLEWWKDYEATLMFCVYLAGRAEADAVAVGCQLTNLQGRHYRWRALIAKVRGAFAGKLCYVANPSEYDRISWWSDLDWIGLCIPLDPSAPLAGQLARPDPIGPDAGDFADKLRRPVLYLLTGPAEATGPREGDDDDE